MIKFNFHEVFKGDCLLSQYVSVITQIHSNITLSVSFMSKSAKESDGEQHPDAYMYFLSTLLSHTREAIKVINDWNRKSVDVREFNKRNDIEVLLTKILIDQKDYEESIVATFLKPVRDNIFHYTDYQNRMEMKEVIESVQAKAEGNTLHILPENRLEGLFVDYSKEIISGIISRGSYNEEDFKKVIGPTTPIIAEIIDFCNTTIGFFLIEKGVEFP